MNLCDKKATINNVSHAHDENRMLEMLCTAPRTVNYASENNLGLNDAKNKWNDLRAGLHNELAGTKLKERHITALIKAPSLCSLILDSKELIAATKKILIETFAHDPKAFEFIYTKLKTAADKKILIEAFAHDPKAVVEAFAHDPKTVEFIHTKLTSCKEQMMVAKTLANKILSSDTLMNEYAKAHDLQVLDNIFYHLNKLSSPKGEQLFNIMFKQQDIISYEEFITCINLTRFALVEHEQALQSFLLLSKDPKRDRILEDIKKEIKPDFAQGGPTLLNSGSILYYLRKNEDPDAKQELADNLNNLANFKEEEVIYPADGSRILFLLPVDKNGDVIGHVRGYNPSNAKNYTCWLEAPTGELRYVKVTDSLYTLAYKAPNDMKRYLYNVYTNLAYIKEPHEEVGVWSSQAAASFKDISPDLKKYTDSLSVILNYASSAISVRKVDYAAILS
jgi:hypothetical protein